MKICYSPATAGFYFEGVHAAIPAGAIQIDAAQYQGLLAGQAEGKTIRMGATGQLELSDEWIQSPVEMAASLRRRRDRLLAATDVKQLSDYPLTEEQRALWAAYRRALRELPEQPGFPTQVDWPTPPEA